VLVIHYMAAPTELRVPSSIQTRAWRRTGSRIWAYSEM